MTEADFAHIETRLGITLPTEYRRVMSASGPTLLELARDYRGDNHYVDSVFVTPERVVSYNLSERLETNGAGGAFPGWWRTYFMAATDGGGNYYCLRLDGRPGLWMIGSDCGDEPRLQREDFAELVTGTENYYRAYMSHPELVVVIPWYSDKGWVRLRAVVPDPESLRADYRGWQVDAEAAVARLEAGGKKPHRVYVDAEAFLGWCSEQARVPNAVSREAFAVEALGRQEPWFAKWCRAEGGPAEPLAAPDRC
ncbi:SMI1 / KNR4 family protein [Gemmata sp. SH-PL17]|uniref:SMI1/KNR4 family protein n=1 Tax=Gemmata sp. SH-PL17 TaxID=1630693 RepID=UPI00078E7588|nr:SMI1/KNR4 family protein [Gemmata sp. SH-PL17]AMV30068.1 SMI1 / KNR4 family protein [Gemmata sp. SH-PL17]